MAEIKLTQTLKAKAIEYKVKTAKNEKDERPDDPLTEVGRILEEYNHIESDIPITHEYWKLKHLVDEK